MPEKTEKEMVQDLYVFFFGIDGNSGFCEEYQTWRNQISERSLQHSIALAALGGILIGLGIIQFLP